MLVIIAALFAGIAATTQWANPKGSWTPKLGLDLEGGRQIVLQPIVNKGQSVNSGQLDQAVSIIRQRVDGTGVSEAEVTTLGGNNIVVSMPGNPSKEVLDSLAQSSQLLFRAVITSTPVAGAQTPTQTPTIAPTLPMPASSAASSSGGSSSAASSSGGSSSGRSSSAASTRSARAAIPDAFRQATSAPASPSSSSTPSASSSSASPSSSSASESASSSASPSSSAAATKPANASDPAWATQPVGQVWIDNGVAKKGETYAQLLQAYSCTNTNPASGPTATRWREVAATAPANQPSVGCDATNTYKFLMGPSEVNGSMLSDASYGQETNSQGVQTSTVVVNLQFNSRGTTAFANVTKRLVNLQGDQNRFAVVVDGRIITAPQTNSPILDGRAQISGGFTQSSAKLLADQLRFGALPFSFQELTSDQISPQLGSDQLQKGIMAGIFGLFLVVIYSLFQYRALGFVTVASLLVAAILSYGAVTFLGFANNFRLSMAGVTGLIVSIGITADSFIVYFERVRDEVRTGRPLRAAVETGWARAKRTIIISDSVNFLAAAVLYFLSESNVKAFAFTLGLTTIIDLIVVMMFTHPTLTLLARTEFFGNGHKWSGFDPERLGASGVTYAGRGRVTIADRRATAATEGGQA